MLATSDLISDRSVGSSSGNAESPHWKEANVEELERWHLREEQWRAALDKIFRDRPDYFPTLGIVLEYLRAQQSMGVVSGGVGWRIFDLGGGQPKARRIRMDAIPPAPPGATNVRIVADDQADSHLEDMRVERERLFRGFEEGKAMND